MKQTDRCTARSRYSHRQARAPSARISVRNYDTGHSLECTRSRLRISSFSHLFNCITHSFVLVLLKVRVGFMTFRTNGVTILYHICRPFNMHAKLAVNKSRQPSKTLLSKNNKPTSYMFRPCRSHLQADI
jgi:hypothetical protein